MVRKASKIPTSVSKERSHTTSESKEEKETDQTERKKDQSNRPKYWIIGVRKEDGMKRFIGEHLTLKRAQAALAQLQVGFSDVFASWGIYKVKVSALL